ncbi:MAG TPA: Rv3235 family protein [Mycobacteriales bacterium]|nr:Rv3235 family protein [Mycobacteriales bacterium]
MTVAPQLTLRPAPAIDGPYDDELPHPPAPPVDGAVALAFPPATRPGPPLRLVPPAQGGPVEDAGPPTARDVLPNPRPWSARLAQAIAEVLAGARPAWQLARVTSFDVLQLLERGSGRLSARPGSVHRLPVVSSVHLSEPRHGIAEACAVVATGHRCVALALRLEGANGAWKCTAVHIG